MVKVINIHTNQEVRIEYIKRINCNKLYKIESLNNNPNLNRWVNKHNDYTVVVFNNDEYYYYEIYFEKERVSYPMDYMKKIIG